MFNLEEIKNEIRYLESLNVAVAAYKNAPEQTFYDAVKKQKKIPLINYIRDSDVLLALDVLRIAVTRKLFSLAVREQDGFVDFSSIKTSPDYIKVRDKILKKHPSLANADCNKILRQICNAISHGDILSSFNFKEYEKSVSKIYAMKKTLSTNNKSVVEKFYAKQLVESYYLASDLEFKYESFFEFLPDGSKVKRDKPMKITLKISEDDIILIMNLILDYTLHEQIGKSIYDLTLTSDEKKEKMLKPTKGMDGVNLLPELLNFDEVQKDAFEKLKAEFEKTIFTHTDIFKLDYKNSNSITILELLATGNAMHDISFGSTFTFIKLNRLLTIIELLPININDSKRNLLDIVSQNCNLGQTINDLNEEDYQELLPYIEYCTDGRMHKELLAIQTITTLQDVEQNNLKRLVGACPAIQQIAKEIYEKETFSDKEIIKIIDNIRDAFTHGTYINNIEDEFDIYDQVSRTDKSLEYKFTVTSDTLEAINFTAISALKALEKQLESIDSIEASMPKPKTKKEDERTL
ncbi:MAG: hypothetical protein J6K39_02755 [Clostridia bacterium]|nr:hypothetical protein [Clostridia bacterium]